MAICAWKGAISISPYINVETRMHSLRLLNEDTTQLELEMISKRKKGAGYGTHDMGVTRVFIVQLRCFCDFLDLKKAEVTARCQKKK